MFRLLLRNQWAAALAFVGVFTLPGHVRSHTDANPADHHVLLLGVLAYAVLRWGLTSLTAAVLVAGLFLNLPATTDLSSWYIASTILIAAAPLAVSAWAFRTAIARA